MVPGVYSIILKIKKTDLELKGGTAHPAAQRGVGGSSIVPSDKSTDKEESTNVSTEKE